MASSWSVLCMRVMPPLAPVLTSPFSVGGVGRPASFEVPGV
jgi:hypothetical protein